MRLIASLLITVMYTKLQHKELYLLVLMLGVLLCVTALGGGLFGQSEPWFLQWQHKAFAGLCHQNPRRSFWINSTPMAVCSRCLGIYSGFAVLWALFPLRTDLIAVVKGNLKKVLAGIILLNGIDVAGNSLEFWENTLSSRYLMGTLIGISAAFILACGFIGTQQQKEEKHGTVGTSH